MNQHKTSGTFHITGFYSRVGIIDFLQHILHGAVCSNSLDFLTVNLELGKSLIQACFVSYIIGKSQLVQIIHDGAAGGNLVGCILADLQICSYLCIGGAYRYSIFSVGTVKGDASCGRIHHNLTCTKGIVKILLNSILYRIQTILIVTGTCTGVSRLNALLLSISQKRDLLAASSVADSKLLFLQIIQHTALLYGRRSELSFCLSAAVKGCNLNTISIRSGSGRSTTCRRSLIA